MAKKAFEQCKTETGTATYEDGISIDTWLATVKSERLIDGTELDGTPITDDETTETINALGTVVGKAEYGATTVDEPTQTNEDTGTPGAHEAGMATTDVQVSGTVTDVGTTTTDEAGNEIMVEVTTETTTELGT